MARNEKRILSATIKQVIQTHKYAWLAASIADFLPTFLQQVVTFGYRNVPLENDAKAHEQNHYQWFSPVR